MYGHFGRSMILQMVEIYSWGGALSNGCRRLGPNMTNKSAEGIELHSYCDCVLLSWNIYNLCHLFAVLSLA